jgi:parallel beta-helix repeat protein
MRCPFCLNEVAAFRQETDTHSRPILICPDAACKAEGVPFQYSQEYEHYSPIPFSIVGLRGHGKTVFLTSLFHVFEQIGRPGHENALWPGAYYEPLDEENMHEVRDRLKGLAEGRLPPATTAVFPRSLVVRLSHIPRARGSHLMMFDTGGEAFLTVNGVMAFGRYVRRSPAVIWLISLEDLASPDEPNDSLTVYLQAMAEMAAEPEKQELIVVLTKGDLLLRSERYPELPESASDFLLQHELDPSGDSWQVLEGISADLHDWLLRIGFHQFVNRAEDKFANVRYCILSAQGTSAVNGALEVGLMPRGVLAPLFWLWRRHLGPAVWVDTPEGRELYFALDEALREAPAGSVIHLGPEVYRLQMQVQVRQSIRLLGKGNGKTIVRGSAEGYDIAFGGPDARFEAADILFQHDGTKPADVFRAVRGEIIFRRCAFAGGDPAGLASPDRGVSGDGLILAKDVVANIFECEFTRNIGNGLSIRDNAKALVEASQCRGNKGAGIHCTTAEKCMIVRNHCSGNDGHGIRLGAAAVATIEANICQGNRRCGIASTENSEPVLRGNFCQENGLNGIQVKNDAKPELESNQCLDNQASGIAYADLAAGSAKDNHCQGNAHFGIALCDQVQPRLEENICSNNGQHGIVYLGDSGGSANKNQCAQNSGCGISVENHAVPAEIQGNECAANKSHGIAVASTVAKRVRLRSNNCHDNRGEQTRDLRKSTWFG